MAERLIRACEPLARAEILSAVPTVAAHIRSACVAGALVGAGHSPAHAYRLTRQYEAMGLIPRVGPETHVLAAAYGPTVAALERAAMVLPPVPGVLGVPTPWAPGIAGIPTPWAPGIAGIPTIPGIAGIPTPFAPGVAPWAMMPFGIPGMPGVLGVDPS